MAIIINIKQTFTKINEMTNKSFVFTIISLFLLSKSVYQQSYDLFIDRGLKSIPPDASLSPVELCDKYGYELDTNHSVTT